MPYNHHYIKKYSNAEGWIEEDKWILIPRISEIVNAMGCDWTAYDNDVNRIKRGEPQLRLESANYPALRGTLAHYDIEEFIAEQMGIEIEPLELRPEENKLLLKIEKAGPLPDLYDDAQKAVDNFITFWDAYDPEPIFPEKEIVHISYDVNRNIDVEKSCKGTMDFIAGLDVDRMSRNALIELKKDNRELVSDKFVSVIDWKTGEREQASHRIQLQGYYYILTQSGFWQQAIDEGDIIYPMLTMKEFGISSQYAMCVKLGAKKYLNTLYDVKEGMEFFRAWDRFNEPTASAYSAKTNKYNKLKMVCMFCEHRNCGCPLFSHSVTLEQFK